MTLEGKRVLVTGGLGFLGRHLCKALSSVVAEVVVVDAALPGKDERAMSSVSVPERCRVSRTDIGKNDALLRCAMAGGVDAVFHLAAIRAPLCDENPRLCVECMIDGTLNVVEAAKEAGVKRFVFASSRMVYDANPGMYGLAKKIGEEMLAGSGLSWCALRYFNLYGPGMNYGTVHDEVLVKWMKCIESGDKPIINAMCRRDFVYVDDAVAALIESAERPYETGAYDIASGELVSLPTVYRKLLRIAHGETPEPDSWDMHPNLQRLREWKSQIRLDDGLKRTWEWWRNRERPLR